MRPGTALRAVLATTLATVAGTVAAFGVLTAPTATTSAADLRPVGQSTGERFVAGEPYAGQFPDPTVMRDGDRYVASSTTVANLNLPVMSSSDLRTWVPRPPMTDAASYSGWRLYNEAMPVKPTWAATREVRGKVRLMSQWAPSLAKVGGRYLAAYSTAVRLSPRHSCIGIATSTSALGEYRDPSPRPLVCYPRADLGAIDPDIFVERGRAWLLWKNEGVRGTHPPRLMLRRLGPRGTSFLPGSRATVLATLDQGWEGRVVENPSMVRFRGRYYLFYSGNDWVSARYATGYAVCATVTGPCRKPTSRPLLASAGSVAGPGGADALVDRNGRLRLAYAAWDAGRVGPVGTNARRLHVATVKAGRRGLLTVSDRG